MLNSSFKNSSRICPREFLPEYHPKVPFILVLKFSRFFFECIHTACSVRNSSRTITITRKRIQELPLDFFYMIFGNSSRCFNDTISKISSDSSSWNSFEFSSRSSYRSSSGNYSGYTSRNSSNFFPRFLQ